MIQAHFFLFFLAFILEQIRSNQSRHVEAMFHHPSNKPGRFHAAQIVPLIEPITQTYITAHMADVHHVTHLYRILKQTG